ncbi:hypothetical protein ROZALSC1DRAFT_27258 [Rozella allomycis CSF55]|uniref:Uncharacterized protein n=1 Tax=Rozella allomycis (strain CSF55) TaxID=988480 RepID=A0A075B1F5_ROZAC|nr:hypothetical protein O9G_001910 [Rozella allomycis CSF55]RKP21329.1 hypothetical protein ROZALSC1DRAFT_27258 [Rozella allomycis CSF55]|eukprot:EPZ34608.1 hypothetical protein O9G_001910 [Rozella allomycis CSF55]
MVYQERRQHYSNNYNNNYNDRPKYNQSQPRYNNPHSFKRENDRYPTKDYNRDTHKERTPSPRDQRSNERLIKDVLLKEQRKGNLVPVPVFFMPVPESKIKNYSSKMVANLVVDFSQINWADAADAKSDNETDNGNNGKGSTDDACDSDNESE